LERCLFFDGEELWNSLNEGFMESIFSRTWEDERRGIERKIRFASRSDSLMGGCSFLAKKDTWRRGGERGSIRLPKSRRPSCCLCVKVLFEGGDGGG